MRTTTDTNIKLLAIAGAALLVTLTFAPAAVAAASVTDGNDDGGNAPEDPGNAPADVGNFGLQVSDFVHELLSEENLPENETFGTVVSEFVLANNPAADKIPDHAGPPAHAGNASNASDAGNAGATGASGQGPPADAGQSGNASAQGADNGQSGGQGGGPPDHPGEGDDGEGDAASDEERGNGDNRP